jgi:hypothetical protein
VSKPRKPQQAKLIVGLLFSDFGLRQKAFEAFDEIFGPADFITEPVPFHYTSYYDAEMGQGILRQWCSFARLVTPETLPDIKLTTNRLESELSVDGRRRVNIDPGILSEERLVLATGKNFTHRVYLRDGIYADLTLIYQRGGFQSLPWTFPDYREASLLHYLAVLRQKLGFQLRNRLPGKPA